MKENDTNLLRYYKTRDKYKASLLMCMGAHLCDIDATDKNNIVFVLDYYKDEKDNITELLKLIHTGKGQTIDKLKEYAVKLKHIESIIRDVRLNKEIQFNKGVE